MTVDRYFSTALWLAVAGHFTLLLASVQVPSRLRWATELPKLSPFNRKLMWTYGFFTVLTNMAFGTLTLVLHGELLRGDRAALGLAAFIGVYWTCRLIVDATYFSHSDWPAGRFFVVGHVLINLLFLFLVSTYLGLLAWRLGLFTLS